MHRLRSLVIVLAMVVGGFFESGCTGFVKEKAGEFLEGTKDWIRAEISTALPKLEDKLTEMVEKKLQEQELKGFNIFDVELAKVAPPDPVTGGKVAKTWKDFDIDKNGHLEPLEVGRISAYVLIEGKKRFDEGTITKEEWSDAQKNTAKGGGILGAVALGAYALKKRKDARNNAPKPPVAAGPDPKTPSPAAAPAPASTG